MGKKLEATPTSKQIPKEEEAEMLEHLDLLMDFELVKKETDWTQIEEMDTLELRDEELEQPE